MDKNMLDVIYIPHGDKQRICVIQFDQPDSGANVMSSQFFDELNDTLKEIKSAKDITGVIFKTLKKKVFLAGADLQAMQSCMGNDEQIKKLIEYGQQTFNLIQSLPCTTVAAIHGVCLGGGLELSLACDYRIASCDASTKIGLPEVMLGILPAWGGCTRLPRLIGVMKSLKFILSGTPKHSKACKKLGIVDKVVYNEHLLRTAIDIINRPPERKSPSNWRAFNWIVFRKTKQITLHKTKGMYPAPLKIIDVIAKGIRSSANESYRLEKAAFLELIKTSACKNLIRIFFLQEQAKKLRWKDKDCLSEKQPDIHPVNNTVVIGAGTMGAGICQWISTRNKKVLLKDISNQQIAAGLKTISKLFSQGVARHKFDKATARSYLANISATTDDVSYKNKDLVLEVVAEKFDIKTKVLADIESRCKKSTIIATNTSAISINKLAEHLKHPERFIGIHFFNPVHKMKLVEIVIGEKTSSKTIARTIEFVKSIGKLPVIVKDSPGFLVNRILLPYLVEAIKMVQGGHSPSEIDSLAVKFGMPMGPLRLLDEIGLDIGIHVATDLAERLKDFQLPTCIDTILTNEQLGKKTGKGFYIYSPKTGKKISENTELLDLIQRTSAPTTPVIDRLVQVMIDEAYKCLDEKIVDSGDILDFAMIMGTGWAPFRGGPIKHSKQ